MCWAARRARGRRERAVVLGDLNEGQTDEDTPPANFARSSTRKVLWLPATPYLSKGAVGGRRATRPTTWATYPEMTNGHQQASDHAAVFLDLRL